MSPLYLQQSAGKRAVFTAVGDVRGDSALNVRVGEFAVDADAEGSGEWAVDAKEEVVEVEQKGADEGVLVVEKDIRETMLRESFLQTSDFTLENSAYCAYVYKCVNIHCQKHK